MNKLGCLINTLSILSSVIVLIITSLLVELISSDSDSHMFVWISIFFIIGLTSGTYRLVRKSLVKYYILNKPAEFEKLLDWERKRDAEKRKREIISRTDGSKLSNFIVDWLFTIIIVLVAIWLLLLEFVFLG